MGSGATTNAKIETPATNATAITTTTKTTTTIETTTKNSCKYCSDGLDKNSLN